MIYVKKNQYFVCKSIIYFVDNLTIISGSKFWLVQFRFSLIVNKIIQSTKQFNKIFNFIPKKSAKNLGHFKIDITNLPNTP